KFSDEISSGRATDSKTSTMDGTMKTFKTTTITERKSAEKGYEPKPRQVFR
ncbi:unnamed protein product, partial [Onchocerca ochengi]|uniref:NADH-quinone oxidoreductase subunit C n=1 Tax=Onchocerca ochengi TaxID=42157 RepID=A0A182ENR0_ONCOC